MIISRSYALRIGLGVMIVIVYFYGWRPLRTAITRHVVAPVVVKSAEKNYKTAEEGVSITVIFPWHQESKKIHYRPQAGLFFLICLLTLVLCAAQRKWYYWLAALHGGATMITALLMAAGAHGGNFDFILADFIGRYIVPALSLALAAWILVGKKQFTRLHWATNDNIRR